MAANTTAARNEFAVLFSIGGATAPKVEFNIPTTHLEIPTHNIEDVIGVEVNFMGLPTDISNTNEMSVRYYGVVPA